MAKYVGLWARYGKIQQILFLFFSSSSFLHSNAFFPSLHISIKLADNLAMFVRYFWSSIRYPDYLRQWWLTAYSLEQAAAANAGKDIMI